MGAQEPAFLLRGTVNLEQTGSPRHEHLSTGLYTLMDVICIGCNSPMGWQYLEASQEASQQQYINLARCRVFCTTMAFVLVVKTTVVLLLMQEQKYKEGATLLRHSMLKKVTS